MLQGLYFCDISPYYMNLFMLSKEKYIYFNTRMHQPVDIILHECIAQGVLLLDGEQMVHLPLEALTLTFQQDVALGQPVRGGVVLVAGG